MATIGLDFNVATRDGLPEQKLHEDETGAGLPEQELHEDEGFTLFDPVASAWRTG